MRRRKRGKMRTEGGEREKLSRKKRREQKRWWQSVALLGLVTETDP